MHYTSPPQVRITAEELYTTALLATKVYLFFYISYCCVGTEFFYIALYALAFLPDPHPHPNSNPLTNPPFHTHTHTHHPPGVRRRGAVSVQLHLHQTVF